jgi:hypothetical protein
MPKPNKTIPVCRLYRPIERVSAKPFARAIIAMAAPTKKAMAGLPNQISNPARPTIIADKALGMVLLTKKVRGVGLFLIVIALYSLFRQQTVSTEKGQQTG